MSVIRAEIEVDETDIPSVTIGQPAKVTIDALPDKTFVGKVTEVGNSPIARRPARRSTTRATNFKVVVTLVVRCQNVRPGFTCTAVITTATRQKVVAVPIQAMTRARNDARSRGPDRAEPLPTGRGGAPRRRAGQRRRGLKPGQTRKEVEGVFVIRDGHAVFTPIKTGIAGEKYFEVLDGMKDGDQVITGPFASVRGYEGRRRGEAPDDTRAARKIPMQQFLESARIALQAIWSNKLRSLLTVLGNIVAVTSIIAVVSLVQGLNSSVKDAIQSGVGVDTFTVTRVGITRTDDDALRAQSNPRVTLDDATAIRRGGGVDRARHGAGEFVRAVEVPRTDAGQRRHPGRDQGIHQPADDQRRAGPHADRDRIRRRPPRHRARLGHRGSAVRRARSASTRRSRSTASASKCSAWPRRRARSSASRRTSTP